MVYIFYHRHTNGTWYSRQGCAEKIKINEDGTIPQVEITSCGLNNGPLIGKGEYPVYIACNIFTDKPSKYVVKGNPKIVQKEEIMRMVLLLKELIKLKIVHILLIYAKIRQLASNILILKESKK